VLFDWLGRRAPGGLEGLAAGVEDLMRATAEVTAAEPGAIWTLRALRAVPQLAHVRIASHRLVTDRMAAVYAPLLPDMEPEVLWRRLRLSVEFGFATDPRRRRHPAPRPGALKGRSLTRHGPLCRFQRSRHCHG